MEKIVYTYDPKTLELLGQYPAQESPLEPGSFIIPTYSTGKKPPKAVEGMVTLFKNKNWELQVDNRGIWYDSTLEAHEVLDLDTVIPADWSRTLKVLNSYTTQRAKEYPPITDYLDAIVKDDKKAVKAYIEACKAVKEKYPKEPK